MLGPSALRYNAHMIQTYNGFACGGLVFVVAALGGCGASSDRLAAFDGEGRVGLVGERFDPIPEPTRSAIEAATGLKGAFFDKENVFKVTQGRADVKVAVEGRVLEPFMGLTSW